MLHAKLLNLQELFSSLTASFKKHHCFLLNYSHQLSDFSNIHFTLVQRKLMTLDGPIGKNLRDLSQELELAISEVYLEQSVTNLRVTILKCSGGPSCINHFPYSVLVVYLLEVQVPKVPQNLDTLH